MTTASSRTRRVSSTPACRSRRSSTPPGTRRPSPASTSTPTAAPPGTTRIPRTAGAGLYDLESDPWELDNLLRPDRPPSPRAQLMQSILHSDLGVLELARG